MNKKGSLVDIGYMVVLIFALAIMYISFSAVWGPAIDIAKNTTAFNQSTEATAALNASKEMQNRFDGVIFTTLIAFFLAIIIVSWYVPTDSIFAFIYLVGLVIFIVLSLVFSYVYHTQIMTIPILGEAIAHFPMTDYILENFGIITTVIGFIGMVILFAKPTQNVGFG